MGEDGLVERERLSKPALLARLPDAASPGTTSYRRAGEAPGADALAPFAPDDAERIAELAAASETGSLLFARATDAMLILPPFAVDAPADYDAIETGLLLELLERRRSVAVFLLRRGGYTMGFFRGDFMVASKTDRRFVKNRHRKGGQSQGRYDRIREKQVHELFGMACEDARATFTPYETEIEHVFFGGDRIALGAFRKECAYFERFGERVMRRVLPVAGDPRRASLDAVVREVWASDVWVVGR
jgi:hypothetical protein